MARPKQVSDEELLNATLSCIHRFGHQFSTRAVAESLNVSPQAILKRMGSKSELLIRSFIHFVQVEIGGRLLAPVDERPFNQQLIEQGERLTAHFIWIEKFRALFVANGVDPKDVVTRFASPPPLKITHQLAGFFEDAASYGFIRNIDSGLLGDTFYGALGHQSMLRHTFPQPDAWEDYESYLARLCAFIHSALKQHPESDNEDELPVEIERKYLLKAMPDFPESDVLSVSTFEQGYIPGSQIAERLRMSRAKGEHRFTRTVKLGSGLKRLEFEEEIDASLYNRLWPATSGLRIRKERTVVLCDGLRWELDRFLDRSLYLAEVELPSVGTEVVLPTWIAACCIREVTHEKNFTNWALANQSGSLADKTETVDDT